MAEGDEEGLDGIEELVYEAVCLPYAANSVLDAMETMLSMCGNWGQVSLVMDTEDDFADEIEDIANGDFDEVYSSHPEAVGEIILVGNQICYDAAETCQELLDAAEAAELDIPD